MHARAGGTWRGEAGPELCVECVNARGDDDSWGGEAKRACGWGGRYGQSGPEQGEEGVHTLEPLCAGGGDQQGGEDLSTGSGVGGPDAGGQAQRMGA